MILTRKDKCTHTVVSKCRRQVILAMWMFQNRASICQSSVTRVIEWLSLSMMLKKFLNFPKSEPPDSYKLDSCTKKCVDKIKTAVYFQNISTNFKSYWQLYTYCVSFVLYLLIYKSRFWNVKIDLKINLDLYTSKNYNTEEQWQDLWWQQWWRFPWFLS
mgnify:CR=1 FL=1